MTGILKLLRPGIFSDVNNIIAYPITDGKYGDKFGITGEEVSPYWVTMEWEIGIKKLRSGIMDII